MSNSMKAASMLARAASDPEFRARFTADPAGVSAECGVTIHPHPNYEILQDEGGVRNIVVVEAEHGTPKDAELGKNPTIADIRRWATWHVHAGDATGTAIRNDINAAIIAAGATSPAGMTFKLSVDDAETMHIAIPMASGSEVSIDQAETFAGAGTEVSQVTTVESIELGGNATVATEIGGEGVHVEVAVVPGFVT